MVKSYRDLEVWQQGIDLTVAAYEISARFPREEKYGLTSQIRRSSSSVPCNVAEGHARSSTREFLRFLSISQGSIAETETLLFIASRLDFLDTKGRDEMLVETERLGRMIRSLQKALYRRLPAAELARMASSTRRSKRP